MRKSEIIILVSAILSGCVSAHATMTETPNRAPSGTPIVSATGAVTVTHSPTPTTAVTATEIPFGTEVNLDGQVVKTISWGLYPRRLSSSGEALPQSVGVEFFLAPIRQDWTLTPAPTDDVNILLIDKRGVAYLPDPSTIGPGPNPLLAGETGPIAEYKNILFLNAPVEAGLRVRLTYQGQVYDFLLSDQPEGYGGQYLSRDIAVVAGISAGLGYPWDPRLSQSPWYTWPFIHQDVWADPTASAALVATLDAMDIPNGPVVELTSTPTPLPFRWDDPETDAKLRALVDEHLNWLTFPNGPVRSTDFESSLPFPVMDGVEETMDDGSEGTTLEMCDRSGMQAALERMEAGGWYMRLRNWRVYDWYPPSVAGFDRIYPKPRIDGTVERVDRKTGVVQGSFSLLELYLDWQFSLAYLNDGGWHLRTSPLCGWTDRAARR